MKQHRYYAEHHDTSPDERLEPSRGISDRLAAHRGSRPPSRFTRGSGFPDFAQPGPQAGDMGSVRFLAARNLRRLDIEGPSPLVLSINGRAIRIVHPGENSFDPPVSLEAGDTLQLEATDPCEVDSARALPGWIQVSRIDGENGARGGRHA